MAETTPTPDSIPTQCGWPSTPGPNDGDNGMGRLSNRPTDDRDYMPDEATMRAVVDIRPTDDEASLNTLAKSLTRLVDELYARIRELEAEVARLTTENIRIADRLLDERAEVCRLTGRMEDR